MERDVKRLISNEDREQSERTRYRFPDKRAMPGDHMNAGSSIIEQKGSFPPQPSLPVSHRKTARSSCGPPSWKNEIYDETM